MPIILKSPSHGIWTDKLPFGLHMYTLLEPVHSASLDCVGSHATAATVQLQCYGTWILSINISWIQLKEKRCYLILCMPTLQGFNVLTWSTAATLTHSIKLHHLYDRIELITLEHSNVNSRQNVRQINATTNTATVIVQHLYPTQIHSTTIKHISKWVFYSFTTK